MSVLGNVINWILGLGAAIFVPIIIIIAGLIVGMKIKDAISAGITLGVAFTGMSMLIGFMSDAIGPAAKAMLTHTGINLPIVDGGWDNIISNRMVLAICILNVPTDDRIKHCYADHQQDKNIQR